MKNEAARSRLGTIVTAMITPFDEHGSLDIAEAQRLARWLVDRETDGLVLAGSTGEGQTLDKSERAALWAAVKSAVGDRAKVIANAGTNSTRESVAAAQDAAAAGADAILAVVPYYNKPTQSGMIEHFGAIADATPGLPVVIYNIPGRTGVNMLPETLLELARLHPNVCGVKESSGDLKQIATIIRDRKKDFVVFAGDDPLFLPCLALGADGVVGVASHLCSREYRKMFDAYRSGHVEEAAGIHASLLPLMDALFATTSPIPVKWAMRQLGFKAGECRLPLDGMPDSIAKRLQPLLAPFAGDGAEKLVNA
ncbi:MAG TPA: 4-hydroxy-tetrahydrodipicolinate synthase [Candidatus Baltobacteraceae bacterium]|jgi:4-hydroxy-tetrahydrodipicolinate synthase|nr:4-hydroxy-tetrahydrodipicolinate synthase [Candidatus Baltobacteraceae bacterium]